MAIACPGCSLPMAQLSVDAHYGRTVSLDLCHACGAFWFDVDESLALTPGAVLKLFVIIAERHLERRLLRREPGRRERGHHARDHRAAKEHHGFFELESDRVRSF